MSHHQPMSCPVDGATLVMSERQGIEIDYCPTCRGVWLDRGELDKIIERSAAPAPAMPPRSAPPYGGERAHHPHYDDHRHDRSYKKRRKSFLEELFD
ncbi:MAG: zf-TFIIB domain-containing protein [Allosphingosinicella sp.]|uniref:TFIIB-type zinc ribbon-containing protein n=1 Tax=Allosphingosinicella sp. TaxID=2823234 RepID=UPI003922FFD0